MVGACGKMGSEVVRAVTSQGDMELVGAVDVVNCGEDIGQLVGLGPLGVPVVSDLTECLKTVGATHAVDFTTPRSVKKNATAMLNAGVRPVVGTTGLSQDDIEELTELSERQNLGGVIAPNFAIGAALMMKFAVEASKYFPSVEIVELHHDRKLDAPSGTAIRTAEMIVTAGRRPTSRDVSEIESLSGARGGALEGIRIHCIRLPGLIAHQEVILGNEGQILTIRHDSTSRTSFMPGVILAIRRVTDLDRLVYGMESLLDL
ncbi:MAG: 4-hydroxy-tetrahydrodipicolinate reductase [Bacillota bacterium]